MAGDDLLTERLLRVIDEGQRTATYKLALLLALVDTAVVAPEETTIGTRRLAARVLALYYPQTKPYMGNDHVDRDLRQITTNRSTMLTAISELRRLGETAGCRGLEEVQRRHAEEYDRALEKVEDALVRHPIPRLQVVGGQPLPFLYHASWTPETSLRSLRRRGHDHIHLLDGVADRLVTLGPLIRPLIEVHWTRDVANWTRLKTEEEHLRAHLFGSERTTFPRTLREGLAQLHDHTCFYCGEPLQQVTIDHFLAWSRWPNDAIENLVPADRCNTHKSNHLAAPEHLVHWVDRCRSQMRELSQLADASNWPSDPDRSTALTRSTYGHVPPDTPLWVRESVFVPAEGPIHV